MRRVPIAGWLAVLALACHGGEAAPPELRDRAAWALLLSARARAAALAEAGEGPDAAARGNTETAIRARFDLSDEAARALLARAEREGWRSDAICRLPGSEPIRQHAALLAPEPRSPIAPPYPPEACRTGVEGVVILDLVVGADGRVGAVEVLRGLPGGLTESAVAAARASRWSPALLCGAPAAVHYLVSVPFRPASGCPPAPPRPPAR